MLYGTATDMTCGIGFEYVIIMIILLVILLL